MKSYVERFFKKHHKIIYITTFVLAILLTLISIASAEVDLDRWADAIRKAEGNPNYGIVSIKCNPNTDECRRFCKNTIFNTLVKYRDSRCNKDESDLDCLARRYAPIGVKNDPDNLNKNWKKNVAYFLGVKP